MRSRIHAAFALAALLAFVPGAAPAKQLPKRIEMDDAACDPKLGPKLTPRLLGVVVNDTDVDMETTFLQRPCGAVLARQVDLEAARIKTSGHPTVVVNGEKYLDLNAYEGLTYEIKPDEQRIVLEGEPAIFYPTVLNFEKDQSQRSDPPPAGAFLNYGLFLSGDDSSSNSGTNYSGSAGLGVFGRPGVLTSDWLYTHAGMIDRTFRLATTFTHDDEDRIASLRVGDVVARPGAFGGGAGIAGVQYGSNFSLRPGMITSPVQMMEAATRRNANVDLQSYDPNDPDRNSRAAFFNALTTAPYGPVELVNIPTYDNGEYQMVLRDRYGREVSVKQEFYFNQGLLREGLTDYSVEAGVQRQGAVGNDYHGGFISGTRRHGEGPRFTDEVHAEASGTGYATGVTGIWAVPHWGVVSVTAAASNNDLVSGPGSFGAVNLENRYRTHAYVARVECRDRRFYLPAENSLAPNRATCTEFAGLSGRLPWHDTASITVSNADLPLTTDVQSVLASYSTQILPGSQLQVFGGVSHADTTIWNAGLTFTLAFGAAHIPMPLFSPSRTSLTVLANTDSQSQTSAFGRVATGAGTSDNAYGFQAGAALDGRDQQQVSGSWSGGRAVAVTSVTQSEGTTNWSAGGSSALVFMDGGVFASRPLFSSFALVRLGKENSGVRVNDFHTNSDGDLVVSPLQPYYENPVNLNVADLPVNARVQKLQYGVRPRFRSGVVLRPTVEQARDALLTIELEDNGARVPLPLGGYATIAGAPEPFPVGEDGVMYVAGVGKSGLVTVHYREQKCELRLKLPEHPAANTTPDLGKVFCEGVRP